MTSRTRATTLGDLAAATAGGTLTGDPDREIDAIVVDSRRVRPGALFVALRGASLDGHAFAAAALAAGAAAVVVDRAAGDVAGPRIVVADTHAALSRLAAAFYGQPSRALRAIGVTGTNGKTTVTHLVAGILTAAGQPCGVIGTLGVAFAGDRRDVALTTPLAHDLHALLAELRDTGAAAVAMEVSSHALALARVDDVAFSIAALTNVTRDHLDFHGDFATYAATKRRLFERAPAAVLNADDALGAAWAAELAAAGVAVTTYGFAPGVDVRATGVTLGAGGSAFTVDGARAMLPLPGRFNVANALCALAIARRCGVADAVALAALATAAAVPGRMERVAGDGVSVLIDYAHTPDALASVLATARETTTGEVRVVFGCGGDRDRGKRPEMGRIAAELADRVTVTTDNPRSESPETIAAEIVAGMTAPVRATIELDRATAIGAAITGARPGDVVVIAGKGHETYQLVGTRTLAFDDRAVARTALAARAAAHAGAPA